MGLQVLKKYFHVKVSKISQRIYESLGVPSGRLSCSIAAG
jgi:hypothetical protein